MTDAPKTNVLDRFFPRGSHPLWEEFTRWLNETGYGDRIRSIAEQCYGYGLSEGKYQGSQFGPYVPWSNYHDLWERVKRLTERVDRMEVGATIPAPKGEAADAAKALKYLREREIEGRIAAAVEAEREACAWMVDRSGDRDLAKYIRSRGKEVKP